MIQNVQETGRKIRVRPTSRLRAHFLSLARRIIAWRPGNGTDSNLGTAVGVTSADPRVGRTLVSFNLAAALASLGTRPVLLVETHPGSTGFSRRIPRPGYGLSELLQGNQSAAACICQTNVDNLYVLPCGLARGQEALELPVEALSSINPELCSSFQYVIYDLPAASDTNLCFPILQHLDGSLIVNESNLQKAKVQRLVRRINEMSAPVIGLILNRV